MKLYGDGATATGDAADARFIALEGIVQAQAATIKSQDEAMKHMNLAVRRQLTLAIAFERLHLLH